MPIKRLSRGVSIALTISSLALIIAMVGSIVTLIVAVQLSSNNTDQIDRNQAGITFFCNTTGVFDTILVQSIALTQARIDDGTYKTLLDKGSITQAVYDDILANQQRFRDAHRTISNPAKNPCPIEGK
jgi:hypothetical protein